MHKGTIVGFICLLASLPLASEDLLITSKRFDVKIDGRIYERKAYGGYRTIYILKEKKTGNEYIGIVGLGVTELVSTIKPGPIRYEKRER